jgi:hypothetical protein
LDLLGIPVQVAETGFQSVTAYERNLNVCKSKKV